MPSKAPDIFIVLATRNGASFLPAQLESLEAQVRTEWTLLVRDDASTDATPEILAEFARRDPRVEVLPAGVGDSAASNFGVLLQAAVDRGADYVFCCDQDDIWLPEKLDAMLERLQKAEISSGQPALVHHDLRVVDEHGQLQAASFWRLMALEPGTEAGPERLLSRNEVTGCALGCNRALLERALPLPADAIMHDWWLALHAAFCGTIRPARERLVQYRQHGQNQIGAKSYRAGLNPLTNWAATWRAGNAEFLATVRQAAAFAESLSNLPVVSEDLLGSVKAYAALPALGRLSRLGALRRSGAWRHNLLLDTVLVLRMLLLGRETGR